MREADSRSEMMDRLEAYLQEQDQLAGLLEWEAGLSLFPEISGRLRADLDRIALIGEEVEFGLRDEQELIEAARSVLDDLTAKVRTS